MQNNNNKISELIELNDELENYFRNTIIPQLFVDADMRLRKFTPPAMRQFRLHQHDIGKPLEAVKDNLRFPNIVENIEYVVKTGKVLEKEIQTTDMRWYQMNILPYIVLKGNRTNGVIITFVDITARIRDLREQEKLVLEHELLLDTISHDIKTPLTSLTLTIDMLKKAPEKGMERYPVLLEKVEGSLSKIKRIIAELTDSRQTQHEYRAFPELLDVEQILEDVRLTLAPQIIESEASITWDISHTEVLFVRRKLRSILYNLINNSVKYRDPARPLKVHVTAVQSNDHIVITVSDNGVGIAEENLERIFTKYERFSKDTEGTGVGLHLVKEIVNLAGGHIEVESRPGTGTSIIIHLKIA